MNLESNLNRKRFLAKSCHCNEGMLKGQAQLGRQCSSEFLLSRVRRKPTLLTNLIEH